MKIILRGMELILPTTTTYGLSIVLMPSYNQDFNIVLVLKHCHCYIFDLFIFTGFMFQFIVFWNYQISNTVIHRKLQNLIQRKLVEISSKEENIRKVIVDKYLEDPLRSKRSIVRKLKLQPNTVCRVITRLLETSSLERIHGGGKNMAPSTKYWLQR